MLSQSAARMIPGATWISSVSVGRAVGPTEAPMNVEVPWGWFMLSEDRMKPKGHSGYFKRR